MDHFSQNVLGNAIKSSIAIPAVYNKQKNLMSEFSLTQNGFYFIFIVKFIIIRYFGYWITFQQGFFVRTYLESVLICMIF